MGDGITIGRIAPLQSQQQLREQFLGQLLPILGDTRYLFTPAPEDTTTSLDQSLTGSTLTHNATIAARLAQLGLGYYTTFDGATNYVTTPDRANLSFGTGAADSAFSIVALVNVTNTAAARTIFAKWNTAGTLREYLFHIASDDKLQMALFDESTDGVPQRTTDAAITMGAWKMFGGVYAKSTGGAVAANEMTLYQDGVVVASTATNDAGYVAMEDLATVPDIGAISVHAAAFFQGSIALVAVCQKALSASEMWALKKLFNAYFGLSL